ncbi:MAG: polysaccharide biosynthesis C-terminal domain-containing protein [Janthinobacterium lividum]
MGSEGSATSRILNNSIWIGLETIIETAVFLAASVAVARYLGPTKLGYFSFINFFVTVITRTGGSGLSGATRKYMSEYLAAGQIGTARAVYHLAYRYQLLGACSITVLGVAGISLFGDPGYKVMASILVLSIVPGVMSWVPAEANNAFEDARKNTLSAFGYLIAYAIVIVLTLHFHWDLVGIASATLIGRMTEVVLRTIPLHRKLRSLPLDALSSEVTGRIRRFCLQAIAIQLLMTVVWDRSEMVFLKAFSTLEQVAFYSISFGLAANLLVFPRTFGGATGITLMVESSRDPSRVGGIVKSACRYLLLVGFPVNLGAAAITNQVIRITYGARYTGAIPVLIVAAILSIPRILQDLPDILLRAADQQKRLFVWLIVTGVVNLVLDGALIPHFGAVGAAWANGLSQSLGVCFIWRQAQRSFTFTFPLRDAIRLFTAALCMAGLAWFITQHLHGMAGVIIAVVTALPTYILLIRLFGSLDLTDSQRLLLIVNRLPAFSRRGFAAAVAFLVPAVEEIQSM